MARLSTLDETVVPVDERRALIEAQALPCNIADLIAHAADTAGDRLAWNFFEKEAHATPYMTGAYLGKKKVFNLEAGVITQRGATWTKQPLATDTVYHTMTIWSVAGFYDAPVNTEKGTAFNAYLGYFDYEFGPGYFWQILRRWFYRKH